MKTLGSLRVKEKTLDKMNIAIKKYNSQNMFSVSESEFRRLALEVLSEMIINNIPLPVKIESH